MFHAAQSGKCIVTQYPEAKQTINVRLGAAEQNSCSKHFAN